MSSLIVEIVKIKEIVNHPNPKVERLELVRFENKDGILGWQVVVRKNEYKVGDLAIYTPIDSILPQKLEEYLFPPESKIKLNKSRVRSIKIQQALSQGMLIPFNDDGIRKLYPTLDKKKFGDDITSVLDITKFEPPEQHIPQNMKGKVVKKNHPLFSKYLDLDHYKKYPNVFSLDDYVYISEKIHGCLQYDTKIRMVNGQNKKISKIQKDDIILGVDKNNNVTESIVLETYKNGSTEEWLNIKTTRNEMGRGNYFGSVTCTPEHRFYNPATKEYSMAKYLNIGDDVILMRSEYELTPIQIQILIGKLLGDASIKVTDDSASIYGLQKKEHKEYITFFCDALGDIFNRSVEDKYISGFGTELIQWSTVCNGTLKEKFFSFKKDGRKTVPEWIIKEIGPIALAIWYMDDGSLGHANDNSEDKANFATCSFTEEECEILVRCFEKFGIKATKFSQIKKENNKIFWRIRLNADEAEKFFLLITPYIPTIMQYKLPERYRGHTAWLPKFENQYKPLLVRQKITDIEKVKVKIHTKYDIETSTNNYFANNILVHNSSARFALLPTYVNKWDIWKKILSVFKLLPKYQFIVGSRNIQFSDRKENKNKLFYDKNVYEYIAKELNLKNKLEPNEQLFGEIVGYNVQKNYTYGCKQGEVEYKFYAYDVKVDGRWLDTELFFNWCKEREIEKVPLIYTGQLKNTDLYKLSQGPSLILDSNGKTTQPEREGVVIRSYKEEFAPQIGRKILKFVSDKFLLDDTNTDLH